MPPYSMVTWPYFGNLTTSCPLQPITVVKAFCDHMTVVCNSPPNAHSDELVYTYDGSVHLTTIDSLNQRSPTFEAWLGGGQGTRPREWQAIAHVCVHSSTCTSSGPVCTTQLVQVELHTQWPAASTCWAVHAYSGSPIVNRS